MQFVAQSETVWVHIVIDVVGLVVVVCVADDYAVKSVNELTAEDEVT